MTISVIDASLILALARKRVTHAVERPVPGRPLWTGRLCLEHYFFFCGTPFISRRRAQRTCSGGAGIVISNTPSLKLALALAWSVIAPAGIGITREKLP